MDIVLNERLEELLLERKLTPKQLSKSTGIALQSIYNWKNLKPDKKSYKINLPNLIKLCNALNCSAEFLVGRSDNILDYAPRECPPFYTRLREIMEQKKISRYRLVKDTNIYDCYFTVWKSGRDPQLLTLIELADYLGCTLDYLIGRDR